MEDLFKAYWWLLFPLGWFIASGWQSLMNYRKHRDLLDLVKTYAQAGKEIPPALLDKLNGPQPAEPDWTDDTDRKTRREQRRYYRRGYTGWSQVALFGTLAAGFAYAAQTDLYEAGPAFTIVAFVMAAVFVATLVGTLASRPRKD